MRCGLLAWSGELSKDEVIAASCTSLLTSKALLFTLKLMPLRTWPKCRMAWAQILGGLEETLSSTLS